MSVVHKPQPEQKCAFRLKKLKIVLILAIVMTNQYQMNLLLKHDIIW